MTLHLNGSTSFVAKFGLSFACFCAFNLFTSSCRTAETSGLRDAPPTLETSAHRGKLHCLFNSPRANGEGLEVWGTPGGNGYQDVDVVFMQKDNAPASKASLGTVPASWQADITKNGQRSFRSFFKSPESPDLKAYNCISLEKKTEERRANYLCISRLSDATGSFAALWATNTTSQKFAKELTIYTSTCSKQ